METLAFMSYGRWVADCPQSDCTNAREVFIGQLPFRCDPRPDGCGKTGTIKWPVNPEQHQATMASLPVAIQSDLVPNSPQETAVKEEDRFRKEQREREKAK